MSQENIEVARRAFDVWNEGDVDAIRNLYAEDAVVKTGITELGRTFEGDDPIGRWAAEILETWAAVHYEIERIFDVDHLVASFLPRDWRGSPERRRGRARGHGRLPHPRPQDRERADLPRSQRSPQSRRAAGVGVG